MTTAERIKLRRESLGMTQSELAERMGLKGKSSISKIESSGNKVTLKTVEKAAAALNCRPGYLMGWTDEPMDGPIVQALHDLHGVSTEDIERARFDSNTTDEERNLIAAYRSAPSDIQHLVAYALKIKEITDANRT